MADTWTPEQISAAVEAVGRVRNYDGEFYANFLSPAEITDIVRAVLGAVTEPPRKTYWTSEHMAQLRKHLGDVAGHPSVVNALSVLQGKPDVKGNE